MAHIDLGHWNNNILFTDRAEFNINDYIARAPAPEEFDLRQKLEQWRDTGIVIFESCIDDSLINALLSDIEYLKYHKASFDLEVEVRGGRFRLAEVPVEALSDTGVKYNCLENISMAARQLSLNKFVCAFLHHVFQDHPAVIQSLTFWRGSEQPAHLDYPWVRIQTKLPHLAASWIPLEDIHPDAGPLAYYPGSHKHNLIPPFDWGGGSVVQEPESDKTPDDFVNYLKKQIENLNLQKEIFLPKRGDVLIWHGNVLHEGTRVNDRTRTRRSYVTHYTSLNAYPKEFQLPNALDNSSFTALNGGYVFDHPWIKDAHELPSWSP
jgi:phytanoyl-CoA hydroxylase